jgi:hypothetical protein
MTAKSKTKKKATRKGSAAKDESAAVAREREARGHAKYTLESQPGADHELAARITLFLTDEAASVRSQQAIRQAVAALAIPTGITVTHPTVICESVPAILAAIESGETWQVSGKDVAEERKAELLDLLERAEAGEVLPVPDEPKQRVDFPMKAINEKEAMDLADEITLGADDYDRERKFLIRLVCGIAAIKDEEQRHGIAADVARVIFLNLTSIEKEVGHFVERLNAEDEQKGGAR